jgi:phosphoribosylformylglycinamidine synthase subunit PurQ / glutaminase
MRGKPRALVLRAPGTNCDRETALALELAGARPEAVHVEQLLAAKRPLDDFGIVVLPGGFSFGDHLGAGTLWAHRLEGLGDALHRFVGDGRPVLGICNGFQALLKLGLLQGGALAPNASGRFECRWVWLRKPEREKSPLLDGIELIALPVAHGEGRFMEACPHPSPSPIAMGEGLHRTVVPEIDRSRPEAPLASAPLPSQWERGRGEGLGSLLYCDSLGNPGPYPINPNGSEGDVAALANPAGNVLGLMPHPERNVLPGQAPAGREDGAGLAIFRNAVTMAKGWG